MTRIAILFTSAALAGALVAAPASAAVHVVAPGESLWSIAQADGLSPAALAGANGLSANGLVIAGRILAIPAAGQGAPPGGPTVASGAPVGVEAQSSEPAGDDGSAGAGTSTATSAPAPGGYQVQPGDTLSMIAARQGVSSSELAAANGLLVDGVLPAGRTLVLPGQPSSASGVAVVAGTPVPTPGRVTGTQIADVAAANGVPPSLAKAVAWQESGFNNGLVSSANARGVMQIIPSTWSFIQSNLASSPIDPLSPVGNVRAGVLYLRHLLNHSAGDPATAIAGYYQGLSSVRRIGVLPETQRYVSSVLSLRQRFGGP